MASGSAANSSIRRQRAIVKSSPRSYYHKRTQHESNEEEEEEDLKEYDSEFGSQPKLGKKHIQRSIRHLEDNRRERRFHAKVMFKEFALPGDAEKMKEDQLKPFMARVLNTAQSDLEKEAMELVLQDAREKSPDEEEGILTKSATVSALAKYGEFARHCKTIQKLFKASDHSRDGKLQRHELRRLLEEYERHKHRSTHSCSHVVLFVTEHDLDFVLRSADENHDGDIDPNEVVRAIGAWEELAAVKIHDFEDVKCCKGCIIS
ncbi:unnamed protein product [Cylindrotheca closterium]|uniref:EF-hand domain-containing protein n=1 Tax=Cylindrotheca closterium TaxID=2856 RepID=A0AAD2CR57_9STRA|nr:unnamed protein product [Cylindrotheca closterium]